MAKQCDVCGRRPQTTIKRSHAMNKSLRKQNLNLQRKKIQGKKVRVCTSCIKSRYYGIPTVSGR